MHTPALTAAARKQGGFTLLETLIALVVLSIGLLGIAKLVAGAVNANDSGYMRGQASQLAYEMLDQMRANRPGAASGAYNGAAANANCATVACTSAVLAGLDLYNWQARVAATLPNGVGAVVTAAGVGGPVATIVVRWDDSQAEYSFGGAAGGPMTIALESVL